MPGAVELIGRISSFFTHPIHLTVCGIFSHKRATMVPRLSQRSAFLLRPLSLSQGGSSLLSPRIDGSLRQLSSLEDRRPVI